jgi:ABC-type multidrug transport system fused ATPase/permease subunit
MIIHKAMIVVGGLGSVVGSVLGPRFYSSWSLREFKSTQRSSSASCWWASWCSSQRASGISEALAAGLAEPLHLAGHDEPRPAPLPMGATDERPAAERVRPSWQSIGSISFGGVRASTFRPCLGAGEIVGIIGPNGAGKTTLLNVICGLNQPIPATSAGDRVITGMKPNWIV